MSDLDQAGKLLARIATGDIGENAPEYLVLPWLNGLTLMVRANTVKRIEYQDDGKTLRAVEFVTDEPMTLMGAQEWTGDNVTVRLLVHDEDTPHAD